DDDIRHSVILRHARWQFVRQSSCNWHRRRIIDRLRWRFRPRYRYWRRGICEGWRPRSHLRHDEVVRLAPATPVWHRHAIRVVHRRRTRLEDEHPQLREVLTPV